METKGLIYGKDGFVLTVIMNLSILWMLIMMILGKAPLIIVIMWLPLNVYAFYIGVFAGTRYYLNDDGIYTDSLISGYTKEFKWSEVKKIEETSLAFTNHARGDCLYYVISTADDVERERGLVETMKCKEILCVPVMKETKACMVYFVQKYELDIERQTKSKRGR